MIVTVIDYGMGNVGSILNMIRKAGGECARASRPEDIAAASKLVLPGVGTFDNGMRALEVQGLVSPILESVRQGTPFLGICLGMQLMVHGSEEGSLQGLGMVDGYCRRFRGLPLSLKVPHMGWNTLQICRPCPVIARTAEEQRFYFLHSYYVDCNNPSDVVATANYGIAFIAAFQRQNMIGVQFHPEKSHRFGIAMFRRFLEL